MPYLKVKHNLQGLVLSSLSRYIPDVGEQYARANYHALCLIGY